MTITNETLETILHRRSTREFSKKPIPREVLETLMDMAMHAPSPMNNQPWSFKVVTSPTMIDHIAQEVQTLAESVGDKVDRSARVEYNRYLKDAVFFKEAPAVIVVCMKPMNSDARGYLWGLPGFFKDEIEARGDIMCMGAACQNIQLAAESLGLGTCMMLYPLIANDTVRPLLDIRDPWKIMCYIPVGYKPENSTIEKPKRRKLDRLVTFIKD